MNYIKVLSISGMRIAFVIAMLFVSSQSKAQDSELVVRVAKIEIDPTQLENYKAALKEEIETSVRVEPGVLTLNAVADKKNPAQITVFEIYANDAAYKSHIETPHFQKYKATTKDMVKSLKLIDTTPIALASKTKK